MGKAIMKRRGFLTQALSFTASIVGVVANALNSSKAAASASESERTFCGVATGKAPQQYLKPSKRLPTVPDRSSMEPQELRAYDILAEDIKSRIADKSRLIIGGLPESVGFRSALIVAPKVGAAIMADGGLRDALWEYKAKPGHFTHLDHETTTQVLLLDSGYLNFNFVHTPRALAAGVKMETIEALRDHRDDLIHPDDWQRVEFVRAVRDGKMTDDIWYRMKSKLGTDRGVVEFVHVVLHLEHVHKFDWACGDAEMSRADYDKMLSDIKSGVHKLPPYTDPGAGVIKKHYSCA
jgi:hypothetical protein